MVRPAGVRRHIGLLDVRTRQVAVPALAAVVVPVPKVDRLLDVRLGGRRKVPSRLPSRPADPNAGQAATRPVDAFFRLRAHVAMPLVAPYRHGRPSRPPSLSTVPAVKAGDVGDVLRHIVAEEVRRVAPAGRLPTWPPDALEAQVTGQTAMTGAVPQVLPYKAGLAVPSANMRESAAGAARPPEVKPDTAGTRLPKLDILRPARVRPSVVPRHRPSDLTFLPGLFLGPVPLTP